MSRQGTLHGRSLPAPAEHTLIDEAMDPTGDASTGRLIAVFKLVLGIALVVLSSAGIALCAYRYALTTPRFAIDNFRIEGAKRLLQAEILELSGVRMGQNIFQVDIEQAEKKLTTNPYVRQVSVTRELPSTLRIELVENEPLAIGVFEGVSYLLTQQAEPFKKLAQDDPYDLPVVTGLSAENLARDRPRELERIGSALQLIRAYESLPIAKRYPAQEVHLKQGGGFVLTVGKAGISLYLGRTPSRHRLLMASRVIKRAERLGRAPGVVFLDNEAHPERVVMRLK